MIQRIQTLYMSLAALANGLLYFLAPIGKGPEGAAVYLYESTGWMVLAGMSSILAGVTIFQFSDRQRQFVLNRLNLLLQLILLGFFVYRSLSLSGGADAPEKGIGMLGPVLTIVLLVLANRAIKKDEDLVKSVDRLR